MVAFVEVQVLESWHGWKDWMWRQCDGHVGSRYEGVWKMGDMGMQMRMGGKKKWVS